MLTSDQEARVRFAYRLWSTGDAHGAPAATVRAANELIDQIALSGAPTSPEGFKRTATKILQASQK